MARNGEALADMFQSSLELSPECNMKKARHIAGPLTVSILTRAFARVQRTGSHMRQLAAALVSILTRAFARVQQIPTHGMDAQAPCFNPHSSFRPSATTSWYNAPTSSAVVSILTRAFARVQRSSERPTVGLGTRFNPHSSFRPSATGAISPA